MAFTSSIAPPSQIDLDHALVLRDLVDGALGEHRAFVQTRDLHAELAHEGHVVLDDDDSAVAIDLLEELGSLARLGVGHAGDRFVHEQQLWFLRQQHADLEPLLLAVRERAGNTMTHRRRQARARPVSPGRAGATRKYDDAPPTTG